MDDTLHPVALDRLLDLFQICNVEGAHKEALIPIPFKKRGQFLLLVDREQDFLAPLAEELCHGTAQKTHTARDHDHNVTCMMRYPRP